MTKAKLIFEHSKTNLEKAKKILRQGELEEVIIILYDCAEKALLSLILHKTKKIPSVTYTLIELAKLAEIPAEYNKNLKKISAKDFRFINTGTYMYDQIESHKNEIKQMIYNLEEIIEYIEKELEE